MAEPAGYYDRQGNPISLEQWANLSDDPSYCFLGVDFVGDRVVASIWLGVDLLFRGPEHGAALFQTTVFRLTDDPNQGIRFDKRFDESGRRWVRDQAFAGRDYSTETDAQAGHAELIELVRRRG